MFQIWLYAVCWKQRGAGRTLKPLQVLVQFWAWLWRCAATIAVNGAITLASSSLLNEDLEPQSFQPSAGCPVGPRVDSGTADRTEETTRDRKQRRTMTP